MKLFAAILFSASILLMMKIAASYRQNRRILDDEYPESVENEFDDQSNSTRIKVGGRSFSDRLIMDVTETENEEECCENCLAGYTLNPCNHNKLRVSVDNVREGKDVSKACFSVMYYFSGSKPCFEATYTKEGVSFILTQGVVVVAQTLLFEKQRISKKCYKLAVRSELLTFCLKWKNVVWRQNKFEGCLFLNVAFHVKHARDFKIYCVDLRKGNIESIPLTKTHEGNQTVSDISRGLNPFDCEPEILKPPPLFVGILDLESPKIVMYKDQTVKLHISQGESLGKEKPLIFLPYTKEPIMMPTYHILPNIDPIAPQRHDMKEINKKIKSKTSIFILDPNGSNLLPTNSVDKMFSTKESEHPISPGWYPTPSEPNRSIGPDKEYPTGNRPAYLDLYRKPGLKSLEQGEETQNPIKNKPSHYENYPSNVGNIPNRDKLPGDNIPFPDYTNSKGYSTIDIQQIHPAKESVQPNYPGLYPKPSITSPSTGPDKEYPKGNKPFRPGSYFKPGGPGTDEGTQFPRKNKPSYLDIRPVVVGDESNLDKLPLGNKPLYDQLYPIPAELSPFGLVYDGSKDLPTAKNDGQIYPNKKPEQSGYSELYSEPNKTSAYPGRDSPHQVQEYPIGNKPSYYDLYPKPTGKSPGTGYPGQFPKSSKTNPSTGTDGGYPTGSKPNNYHDLYRKPGGYSPEIGGGTQFPEENKPYHPDFHGLPERGNIYPTVEPGTSDYSTDQLNYLPDDMPFDAKSYPSLNDSENRGKLGKPTNKQTNFKPHGHGFDYSPNTNLGITEVPSGNIHDYPPYGPPINGGIYPTIEPSLVQPSSDQPYMYLGNNLTPDGVSGENKGQLGGSVDNKLAYPTFPTPLDGPSSTDLGSLFAPGSENNVHHPEYPTLDPSYHPDLPPSPVEQPQHTGYPPNTEYPWQHDYPNSPEASAIGVPSNDNFSPQITGGHNIGNYQQPNHNEGALPSYITYSPDGQLPSNPGHIDDQYRLDHDNEKAGKKVAENHNIQGNPYYPNIADHETHLQGQNENGENMYHPSDGTSDQNSGQHHYGNHVTNDYETSTKVIKTTETLHSLLLHEFFKLSPLVVIANGNLDLKLHNHTTLSHEKNNYALSNLIKHHTITKHEQVSKKTSRKMKQSRYYKGSDIVNKETNEIS